MLGPGSTPTSIGGYNVSHHVTYAPGSGSGSAPPSGAQNAHKLDKMSQVAAAVWNKGIIQSISDLVAHIFEGKLHLDGLAHIESILEHQNRSHASHFEKYGWARISACLYLPLILIQTIAVGIIRGVGYLLAGIFTFNRERARFGANDILSSAVQLIAIPYYGLQILKSPQNAYQNISNYRQKYSNLVDKGKIEGYKHQLRIKKERFAHKTREGIAVLFTSAVDFPIQIIESLGQLSTGLVTGRWKECGRQFTRLALSPVIVFSELLDLDSKFLKQFRDVEIISAS